MSNRNWDDDEGWCSYLAKKLCGDWDNTEYEDWERHTTSEYENLDKKSSLLQGGSGRGSGNSQRDPLAVDLRDIQVDAPRTPNAPSKKSLEAARPETFDQSDDEETEVVVSSYVPPVVPANQAPLPPIFQDREGWRLDFGLPAGDVRLATHLVVEDRQIPYFQKFFLGKEKLIHYAGWDEGGPAIISVVPNLNSTSDVDKFRALIHTKEGISHVTVPSQYAKRQKIVPFIASVESMIRNNLKIRKIKADKCTDIEAQLVKLEKQWARNTYKVGLLYCKENQNSEAELYANVNGSAAFQSFCGLLGEKVELEGWTNFSGGLDTKTNRDGTHSYYTQWNGMEVMFHCSTLLPHSATDKKQVGKKRHIGNDIVIIVFKEGNTKLDPNLFVSGYTHVIGCVQFEGNGKYRFALANKKGVRRYGPHFQEDVIFENSNDFRELLLTKVINAERAAYTAPGFQQKFTRTRLLALQHLVQSADPTLKPADDTQI